jgi:hypothetical protein
MRVILVFAVVLSLALMLQLAIIGRLTLLAGSADLVLVLLAAWSVEPRVHAAWAWGLGAGLVVGLITAAPWYIYLGGYMLVVATSRLVARRIWQAPLLGIFAVTFLGTVAILLATYAVRDVSGVGLSLNSAFLTVILPSLLLNLLLAIPVYALVHWLVGWLVPGEGLL